MPDGSFNRPVTLATLADRPRWVAWQTEGRGLTGKPTKVPYAPDGRKALANDPRSWGTRAEAKFRADLLPKPFGEGGVGIELGLHDGLAIGGVDLDSCQDAFGWQPWAQEVIDRFTSYAEVSPSGTGAKVFFRFDPAILPKLRAAMGTDHTKMWKRGSGGDHPPAIELHLGNRYFAVTDLRLDTSPAELREVPADDLLWLIQTAGPAFAAKGDGKQRRGFGIPPGGGDGSRSGIAYGIAAKVARAGGSYDDFIKAGRADPNVSAWLDEKGLPNGEREARRTWKRAREAVAKEAKPTADADDVLLTEHGVALAFTERHRDRLRFCHDTGAWFLWTGTHWRQDRKHVAFSFARELVAEANREERFQTKAVTGKAAFAGGVERFARADPVLAVTAEEWNPDPWLLGTPGGTVDLRTGILRPAQQGDMITRTTAVAPSDDDAPPVWRDFLIQATGSDFELIGFLKRWCGYCLTGLTREHALLFIYGPGGNGKSVFINTVTGILGEYHATAAMDTFTERGGGQHLAFLAMLAGARMVTAAETEEGHAWAETRIKEMTGGTPITANLMRQNPFTFTPEFKLTITGNHKPVLRNVDDAARRRFNIVPFLHKPTEPDRELEDKLRAEWPAILRWMIDGALAWRTDGLPKPRIVAEATDEYFAAQDAFGRWVEERCILAPHLNERPGKLLNNFNDWAESNGEAPANRPRFRGWAEKQPGLKYKKIKGLDYLSGIGLKLPEGGFRCDR